jgi:methyl-accepting chemotaxis protein
LIISSTAARQISGITDLIATIARKTNLLAINARIEAARAGVQRIEPEAGEPLLRHAMAS